MSGGGGANLCREIGTAERVVARGQRDARGTVRPQPRESRFEHLPRLRRLPGGQKRLGRANLKGHVVGPLLGVGGKPRRVLYGGEFRIDLARLIGPPEPVEGLGAMIEEGRPFGAVRHGHTIERRQRPVVLPRRK